MAQVTEPPALTETEILPSDFLTQSGCCIWIWKEQSRWTVSLCLSNK